MITVFAVLGIRNPTESFLISALIVDGIFITETVFRELARKVNLK
jgi:hypothetical protein